MVVKCVRGSFSTAGLICETPFSSTTKSRTRAQKVWLCTCLGRLVVGLHLHVVRAHTHRHTDTDIDRQTHRHTQTDTHTCTQTHRHTDTQTHTHTDTQTHTHTDTHTQAACNIRLVALCRHDVHSAHGLDGGRCEHKHSHCARRRVAKGVHRTCTQLVLARRQLCGIRLGEQNLAQRWSITEAGV